jgi:hypothetical protein
MPPSEQELESLVPKDPVVVAAIVAAMALANLVMLYVFTF